MNGSTDKPKAGSGASGIVKTEHRPSGPVPMHHLLKLGDNKAPTSNPFGEGPVSTKSTITNGGNGW